MCQEKFGRARIRTGGLTAKGRAVLVVGHAHWGKSRTLRALTDGAQRYVHIGTVEFFTRRMSNDDRPNEFYDFIRDVQPSDKANLIVAFCPEFQQQQARRCLERLRQKGYRLFFWVLRQKYGSRQFVARDEIATLGEYGHVEVYEGQAEDHTRANTLRLYIENVVLA